MRFDRFHSRYATTLTAAFLTSALVAACSGRHDRPGAAGGGEGESQEGAQAATSGNQRLTIKGSDTMVVLAQRWAEAFMAKNPGTQLQVSGGGSGTGIAALVNGTTDLANASRTMKDREKEQLRESRGAAAHEVRVALDALAVYLNTSNPISSLTLTQLKGIYRGEITNWNEVGGPDRRIVLYSRENNSGTYAYFKEHVLEEEDFAVEAQTLPGTAAVINAVSRDEGGIGYGGIAYAEGVRAINLAAEGDEVVEPTMENATSGRYPLSRYLHIYSAGTPEGLAARYLEYVLSPEGQALVEGVGYYPLPTGADRPAPSGSAVVPAPPSAGPTGG